MSFTFLSFKNKSVTPASSAASKYNKLNGITSISFFSSKYLVIFFTLYFECLVYLPTTGIVLGLFISLQTES